MNMRIFSARSGASRCKWLGTLAMLSSMGAQAITQEIRAEFRPDNAQPHRNVFVNKTPVSGYCVSFPVDCQAAKMFSIRLPLRFNSIGEIAKGVPLPIKVPANWRSVVVRNRNTQETEVVEIRISGIGSTYRLSHSAASLVGVTNNLEGHRLLWGSTWVYAPAPCGYSGMSVLDAKAYMFFWKTPQEAPCTKTAQFLIPHMQYDYLDFAYELRTPNPLGMSSGDYTGQLTYRVGSGGDFDLSDQMVPDDELVVLDFNLNVEHTLKVDVPPGGNKVELVPLGGWQGWLQSGRRPVSLFRDQTFNISASSRFKMELACQHSSFSYDCAIFDPVSRRSVALQVYVTLPNGLTTMAGEPVRRLRLYGGKDKYQVFKPGQYVDRKPGVLHFEVPQSQMAFMLQPGVQSNYFGYVTVIWDSEV